MGLKARLIAALPASVKRWLAVPYDRVQTARADRTFRRKDIDDRHPASDAPRHVVVVVVDALRGDAVDPEYAPFLAGLGGISDAVAPSSWTFPSVTSMVTGQYPHKHGSLRPARPEAEGLQLPPKLPDGVETLPEVFAGAGYDTYGGFGHDTPFVALSGRFASHALFHNITASAEDVFSAYRDWLVDSSGGYRDRTFAYLHLADLHIPVEPSPDYLEKHDVDTGIAGLDRWRYEDVVDPTPTVERYREHRQRLYRAAVEYVDDQVGQLSRDLPGETVLVVTSDHGEAFWEQVALDTDRFDGTGVVGHGGTPYEGVARVPLLTEGLDLRTDGSYASLVDLAPTLLDAVGLPGALEAEPTGHSLLGEVPSDRMPLVEGTMHGGEKKAVYRGAWKLVAAADASAEFALPEEDLATIPDSERQPMVEALPGWEVGPGGPARGGADAGGTDGDGTDVDGTEVSGLVEQRLEDLGYE